jgi:hypothetical protein
MASGSKLHAILEKLRVVPTTTLTMAPLLLEGPAPSC